MFFPVVPQNPKEFTLTYGPTLHLASSLQDHTFSIHLDQNGKALLQGIHNTLGEIKLETFGKIKTDKQPITSHKLSLTGRNIRNNTALTVDELTLTTTDPLPSGKVINDIEGKIQIGGVAQGTKKEKGEVQTDEIKGKAHIHSKYFENRHEIIGTDGSTLDLNGGDFTNKAVGQDQGQRFRSKIHWKGSFTIKGKGDFVNETDIVPYGAIPEGPNQRPGAENCSLTLAVKKITNKRNIMGRSLTFKCSEDFTNAKGGAIKGERKVFFHAGQDLVNRGIIESSRLLKCDVTGQLKNEEGGLIKGGHWTLLNVGKLINRGTIDSPFFHLATQKLENFNKIHIGQKGKISEKRGGEGLFNKKGAVIFSSGILEIMGNLLKNKGDAVSKGIIQAHTLITHLKILKNGGEIIATHAVNLRAAAITNKHSGILHFPKGSHVSSEKITNNNNESIVGEMLKMAASIFENFGKLITAADLILEIGKLFKNAKEALTVSGGALTLTGEGEVINEGRLASQKKINIDSSKATNKGQMISEREVEIHTKGNTRSITGEKKAPDFENSGLILSPTITIATHEGSNKGTILADKGTLTGTLFSNSGKIAVSQDLSFDVKDLFKNEKGALVSSGKGLAITGGQVQNEGDLGSQEKISIHSRKTTNQGQIISEREVAIHTKGEASATTGEEKPEDFTNNGLILSPTITLETRRGSTTGTGNIAEGINLDHLEDHKGLMATKSLNIVAHDRFTNASHMMGGKKMTLSGKGTFDNKGTLDRTDMITSSVSGFENSGTVRAHQSMVFDKLERDANNTGVLLSDGTLGMSSSAKVVNTGIMEGRNGDVSLTVHELENKGLISALQGKLALNIAKGKNHRNIFGQGGIDLILQQDFTNSRTEEAKPGKIKSLGSITIKGPGTLTNESLVEAREDIHLKSNTVNKGAIRASRHIQALEKDKDFTNASGGHILAGGKATFNNTQSFKNHGHIQGAETDITTTGNFDNTQTIMATTGAATFNIHKGKNTGTLSGKEKTDLTVGEKLENKGHIISPNLVAIHGTGEIENQSTGKIISLGDLTIEDSPNVINNGQLKASQNLTATLSALTNNNEIIARDAKIWTEHLHNTKDIRAEETLALQTRTGKNKGEIQAKTLTFTVTKGKPEDKFKNKNTLSASESLTLEGKGKLLNEKDILSGGTLALHNEHLENHSHIQATGRIDISDATSLHNGKNAKLISQTHIEAAEKARVENEEGEIASLGTITFKQPSYANGGRLGAKGDIDFSNCTSLINKDKGYIVSETGQIKLPQLHSLDNGGAMVSEKSLSLDPLSQYNNKGLIHSNESLTLKTPQALEERGKLVGRLGVSLSSPQAITQEPTSLIESAEGPVKLEAPAISLKGAVAGKTIEIKQTSGAFSLLQGTLSPADKLTLHVPGGWDVKGAAQHMGHSLEVQGPLRNPGNLHIKGDFTWKEASPHTLANTFEILVEGFLDVDFKGMWKNSASVQAHKGSRVAVAGFENVKDKGTFYSARQTDFVCERGFDNFNHMEWIGSGSIKTKTGSITNHPKAEFQQKNLSGTKGTLILTAGEKASQVIQNISGTILIAGILEAYSALFSNKQDKHQLNRTVDSKEIKDIEVKRKGKTMILPVRKQTPAAEALWEVGEAYIHSPHLENIGSTLSAREKLFFNGTKVSNLSRKYLDLSWIPNYNSTKTKNSTPVEKPQVSHARLQSLGNITINTKDCTTQKNVEIADILANRVQNDTASGGQFYPFKKGHLQRKRLLLKKKDPYDKAYLESEESTLVRAQAYTVHGAGVENTGQILARGELDIQNGTLTNASVKDIPPANFNHIQKKTPPFTALSDYFKDKDNGFWKVSAETPFKVVPNKPIHLPTATDLKAQLHAITQTPSSSQEPQAVGVPAFWEPTAEEVSALAKTLTPASLIQIPPRIALIGHSRYHGGERMHYHPALVAELVTKCFLETFGFGSLSQKITSAELLARVLDDTGYVKAAEINKHQPAPIPANWADLSEQDQLNHQQRESIKRTDLDLFDRLATVYQLTEDFGEGVLSALVTFPKALRETLQATAGTIAATYLTIRNDATLNNGTLTGHEIDIQTSVLKNTHTIDGNKTTVEANVVIAEPEVQRDRIYVAQKKSRTTGFKEQLQHEVLMRARTDNLKVKAHHYMLARGALFESGKSVELDSEGKMDLLAKAIESAITTQGKRSNSHTYTVENIKPRVIARENTTIHSADALTVGGVDIKSGGHTHVYTEATLTDVSPENVSQHEHHRKKKGTLGRKSVRTTQEETGTPVPNTFTSGGETHIEAEHDMRLRALMIKSGGKTLLTSHQGKIFMEAKKAFKSYCQQKSKKNVAWQAQRNRGSVDEQAIMAQILAEGGFIASAAKGMEVDIKGSLDALEKNPQTAWIKVLRHNPNIKWHIIEEEHRKWNKKVQGLTPGGAALISLAVGIATYGAGTSLCTMVTQAMTTLTTSTVVGAATGTMAAAGFTTLASQAAVSLVNHKGDVGKVLKDLSQKESLRALATEMAVAGLVGQPSHPEDFIQRLTQEAVKSGVRATLNIAQGKDAVKELTNGGLNALANAVAGHAAEKTGDAYHGKPGEAPPPPEKKLTYVEHKGAHLGIGLMRGLVCSKGKASGAVAGGMGGLVAETLAEALPQNWDIRTRADLGRIGAATAALFTGQDVDTAILTATNAIENNFLRAALETAILLADEIETIDKTLDAAKQIAETEVKPVKKAQEATLRLGERLFQEGRQALKKPQASAWETLGHLEKQAYGLDLMGHAHNIPTTYGDYGLIAATSTPWGRLGPVVKEIKALEGISRSLNGLNLEWIGQKTWGIVENLGKIIKKEASEILRNTSSRVSQPALNRAAQPHRVPPAHTTPMKPQNAKGPAPKTSKTPPEQPANAHKPGEVTSQEIGNAKQKTLTPKKAKTSPSKSAPLDAEGRWPSKPGKEWRDKIVGRAQETGRFVNGEQQTYGHRFRSYREAINAAKREDVDKVYLNRGYKKATEHPIDPNRRPDVTVVRKDGKVDAIEVRSKTDNPDILFQRNDKAMKQLPAEREGQVRIVKPTEVQQ